MLYNTNIWGFMKIIKQCEISDVSQEIKLLRQGDHRFSSIRFLGKNEGHLDIELAKKLRFISDKILLFFEYIGLAILTLGGNYASQGLRKLYLESKDQWDSGVRVAVLKVNVDDKLANKVIKLWEIASNHSFVEKLFSIFDKAPANEVARLAKATLRLIKEEPGFSSRILSFIEWKRATDRAGVAEVVLPWLQAAKHCMGKDEYFYSHVLSALPDESAKEIALFAEIVLPLIKLAPNRADSIMFNVRLLSPEERKGFVEAVLPLMQAAPLDSSWTNEFPRVILEKFSKVPAEERPIYAAAVLSLMQAGPKDANGKSESFLVGYFMDKIKDVPAKERKHFATMALPFLKAAPPGVRVYRFLDRLKNTPLEKRDDFITDRLSWLRENPNEFWSFNG